MCVCVCYLQLRSNLLGQAVDRVITPYESYKPFLSLLNSSYKSESHKLVHQFVSPFCGFTRLIVVGFFGECCSCLRLQSSGAAVQERQHNSSGSFQPHADPCKLQVKFSPAKVFSLSKDKRTQRTPLARFRATS